mmetsp:Transcript_81444/g.143627  ORF Transcript_81444/g.143627 Transcript_81444/m.143627 type:complete len:124 (+) Transcript_81444:643-1014(+)
MTNKPFHYAMSRDFSLSPFSTTPYAQQIVDRCDGLVMAVTSRTLGAEDLYPNSATGQERHVDSRLKSADAEELRQRDVGLCHGPFLQIVGGEHRELQSSRGVVGLQVERECLTPDHVRSLRAC